ncbi:S-layer homology domain-containing protein [Paenibacillus sp. MBLB4367]|uniref:S-layer homology domain-containing protein n=1 Tax=Paenibacillus sp. MBLB4367 TaxID=3384767 RepID=UPI003907F455
MTTRKKQMLFTFKRMMIVLLAVTVIGGYYVPQSYASETPPTGESISGSVESPKNFLMAVVARDEYTINAMFSGDVDTQTAQVAGNYTVLDSQGRVIPVVSVMKTDNESVVQIKLSIPLSGGYVYKLLVSNIKDRNGNEVVMNDPSGLYFGGFGPPIPTNPPTGSGGGTAAGGQYIFLTVSELNQSVQFNWSPIPSSGTASSYNIYQDTVKIASVTEAAYRVTGLTNGNAYKFAIAGVDQAGQEIYKQMISDVIPSVSPSLLASEATNGTMVKLVFNEPLDRASAENKANYEVGVLSITSAVLQPDGVTVLLKTEKQLGGYLYLVKVANVSDLDGNLIRPDRSSKVIAGKNPQPGQPQGLIFTASPTGTVLSWTANADANTTGYHVYVNYKKVGTTKETSFPLTGLTDNKGYVFAVSGVNESGDESALSEIDNGQPNELPIAQSAATVTSQLLRIFFNHPVDSDSATTISHYTIDNGLPVLDAKVSEDGRSVFITTPRTTPGMIYQITVSGIVNPSGERGPGRKIYFAGISNDGSTVKGYRLQGDIDLKGAQKAGTVVEIADAKDGKVLYTGKYGESEAPTSIGKYQISDRTDNNKLVSYYFDVPAGTYKITAINGKLTSTLTLKTEPFGIFNDYYMVIAPQAQLVQDETAPAVPTGLDGTLSVDTVTLHWNANTEPDLKGYYVYVNGTKRESLLVNTAAVVGKLSSETNSFQVTAVDKVGNESARSAVKQIVRQPATSPNPSPSQEPSSPPGGTITNPPPPSVPDPAPQVPNETGGKKEHPPAAQIGADGITFPSGALKSVKDGSAGGSGAAFELDKKTFDEAVSQMKPGQDRTIAFDLAAVQESSVNVGLPVSSLTDALQTHKHAAISINGNGFGLQIPLASLDFKALAIQLKATFEDMKLIVTVAKADQAVQHAIQSAGSGIGASPVTAGFDFTLEAEAGGKRTVIASFDKGYVERTISLPAANAGRSMTGVYFDPATGKLYPVPTTFEAKDGVLQATIRTNHNSIYTIVETSLPAFTDITAHWAKKDIEQLSAKLILNGETAQTFNPDGTLTRAQAAAIAARSLGLAERTGASSFTDVGPSHWAAGWIGAAVEAGLVDGVSDNTFQPDQTITREQLFVILAREGEKAGIDWSVYSGELTKFADSGSVSPWAAGAVKALIKGGILQGDEGGLHPQRQVSRAEAAALVKRVLLTIGFMNE